jgi:uncharacterized circularly permuted ATP-grasp superfamily protein
VHRTTNIHRFLKENGVAYNIYNDPSGGSRPWELDPIPQLINASEWELINKGLIQRASLFNLMLKDIYGEQILIKEGIIPQEIIYTHPGFLRSCVNLNLPHQQYLILYAADMARGIDGRIWILSDRSQAPSGYGYALETGWLCPVSYLNCSPTSRLPGYPPTLMNSNKRLIISHLITPIHPEW